MTDRCEPPPELRGVDGDHWLSCGDTAVAAYWYSDVARWSICRIERVDPAAMPGWRYLSPVLTPAEADALRAEVARLREDARIMALALRGLTPDCNTQDGAQHTATIADIDAAVARNSEAKP